MWLGILVVTEATHLNTDLMMKFSLPPPKDKLLKYVFQYMRGHLMSHLNLRAADSCTCLHVDHLETPAISHEQNIDLGISFTNCSSTFCIPYFDSRLSSYLIALLYKGLKYLLSCTIVQQALQLQNGFELLLYLCILLSLLNFRQQLFYFFNSLVFISTYSQYMKFTLILGSRDMYIYLDSFYPCSSPRPPSSVSRFYHSFLICVSIPTPICL